MTDSKITEVYIDTWLLKYLQHIADFTPKGELIVHGRILMDTDSHKHSSKAKRFFAPGPRKVLIRILSRQADIRKLHGLMQFYKKQFHQEMISFTAARHGIMYNQTAIRDFLRCYDIYESDYATERAYKRWQRSPEYDQLKDENHPFSKVAGNIGYYYKVKEMINQHLDNTG